MLVATIASVISPGTERAVTALAQSSLLAKARARPDLVRQVARKARSEGLAATAQAVRGRLAQDLPLGYSAAGEVVEVGSAVSGIRAGPARGHRRLGSRAATRSSRSCRGCCARPSPRGSGPPTRRSPPSPRSRCTGCGSPRRARLEGGDHRPWPGRPAGRPAGHGGWLRRGRRSTRRRTRGRSPGLGRARPGRAGRRDDRARHVLVTRAAARMPCWSARRAGLPVRCCGRPRCAVTALRSSWSEMSAWTWTAGRSTRRRSRCGSPVPTVRAGTTRRMRPGGWTTRPGTFAGPRAGTSRRCWT